MRKAFLPKQYLSPWFLLESYVFTWGKEGLIKSLQNDGILQLAVPVEACDRMLNDSVSYGAGEASENEGYIYTVHTRKV